MNLVKFYLHQEPDYNGRLLKDIWALSHAELEAYHDFIQVLFPLNELSNFNSRAPLLDAALQKEFRTNPAIQANLLRSFEVMLAFYGFTLDREKKTVSPAPHFAERAPEWLFPNDHNHLRLTRILKCMMLCGLDDYARALHSALAEVATPQTVTDTTLRFWKQAVA